MKLRHFFLALFLISITAATFADSLTLESRKYSKSDKDIRQIGHRKIVRGFNFYSLNKEEELGKELAAQAEHSAKFVTDPVITAYVEQVALNVAQNSDADVTIRVRVLDSDEPDACTLAGGYQYITRGLLLRLENESELASVLARGIAHSALHIAAVQLSEAGLAELTAPPFAPCHHF